eukprot:288544-Chlamydomonas_euryale.AAC.3
MSKRCAASRARVSPFAPERTYTSTRTCGAASCNALTAHLGGREGRSREGRGGDGGRYGVGPVGTSGHSKEGKEKEGREYRSNRLP